MDFVSGKAEAAVWGGRTVGGKCWLGGWSRRALQDRGLFEGHL